MLAAALTAKGRGYRTISGPVHLVVEFFMPRPTGHPASRRTVPSVTPDLDKLVRSTCDALTTAGIYVDDALVTDLTTRKRYASGAEAISLSSELDRIGAIITVFELDAADTWDDVPLGALVGALYPEPTLPTWLGDAPTTSALQPADEDLVLDAAATDSQARAIITRAQKLISKRLLKPDSLTAPVDVLIVDALQRLGGGLGRVDDALLELVRDVHERGPAVDVRIVIVEASAESAAA